VSTGNGPAGTAGWRAVLTARWQEQWPGVLPIGHHLRYARRDRWVRFHSLPGSKRYAGNARERGEVLRRHRMVLHELSGGDRGTHVLLLTMGWTREARPPRPAAVARQLRLDRDTRPRGGTWWQSVVEDDSDPDVRFWTHVFVEHRTLDDARLRGVLRRVADDEMADVVIAPPDLRWLYHPYDGGADVIAPTPAERDALRARHPDWLSHHPSGL
jgi:hypothetical protein